MKITKKDKKILIELSEKEYNHLFGAWMACRENDSEDFHKKTIHRCWECSNLIGEVEKLGKGFLTDKY